MWWCLLVLGVCGTHVGKLRLCHSKTNLLTICILEEAACKLLQAALFMLLRQKEETS